MTRWRLLCLIIGGLALFSVVFYAFTGMGFWAPVDGRAIGDFRGPTLVFLHIAGLVAGVIGLIGDIEVSE